MDVRRLVGWNLRRLRVERGYTIEDLAGEAGAEPSFTAKLERGEVNVGIVLLQRYADVLKIAVGDLFRDIEPGSRPPAPMRAGRRPKIPPRPRKMPR